MPKDKEKMTKEEKLEKAKELIQDLKALELTDEEIENVAGGRPENLELHDDLWMLL